MGDFVLVSSVQRGRSVQNVDHLPYRKVLPPLCALDQPEAEVIEKGHPLLIGLICMGVACKLKVEKTIDSIGCEAMHPPTNYVFDHNNSGGNPYSLRELGGVC